MDMKSKDAEGKRGKLTASINRHRVLELLLPLGGVVVARVGDPPVGLHQDGGAEVVVVLVPPVGRARGRCRGWPILSANDDDTNEGYDRYAQQQAHTEGGEEGRKKVSAKILREGRSRRNC